jgi:hypothetical protein
LWNSHIFKKRVYCFTELLGKNDVDLINVGLFVKLKVFRGKNGSPVLASCKINGIILKVK